jgi:PadR family transcriptional regulator, regulatory protein PadR
MWLQAWRGRDRLGRRGRFRRRAHPASHLYHACRGRVRTGIIEACGAHDYWLSPGSIYPILNGLEQRGLLRSREQLHQGDIRRLYRATRPGQRAIASAQQRVSELLEELYDHNFQGGNKTVEPGTKGLVVSGGRACCRRAQNCVVSWSINCRE